LKEQVCTIDQELEYTAAYMSSTAAGA